MHELVLLASLIVMAPPDTDSHSTIGELMGINGHTIQFKPELYAKVCRKARDYHSFGWDMGKDTDFVPRFPEARNRVNWDLVYGSWLSHAFETDVCVMFNETPPESWKDLERDARAYGVAFAKAFGPSSTKKLVASVEIGNEPGDYSDERYRQLFESMAQGLREGDPKLKILTCNMTTGQSGRYEKSVKCVAGLEPLYDVLNIHTYAIAEKWPSWKRTFPEDPTVDFLSNVESLIRWRDEHARGKSVWVTEFGWDASSKPLATTGDAAKWKGNVSDEKQAQYLVRSILLFSAMDIERAYVYFFNDSDEPSFHAASGITRNYQPKPSFHALAYLYRSLNEYRLCRVLLRQADVYAYEYTNIAEPKRRVVVAWSPTGDQRTATVEIPTGAVRVNRAERMPLGPGEAPKLNVATQPASISFVVDEAPTFIWIED